MRSYKSPPPQNHLGAQTFRFYGSGSCWVYRGWSIDLVRSLEVSIRYFRFGRSPRFSFLFSRASGAKKTS